MKKFASLIAILLIAMFALFALGSGEDEGTVDQGSDSAQVAQDDNTSLGDYSVEIKDCRHAKSFDDKDVIIIKYLFTNNSNDTPTAFYTAFDDAVYQNDIGLNEAYVLKDSANYNPDNRSKEIKKGASLEVEVAYELNDTTSDIVVEVKELFSFSDKTITKTFKVK